MPSPRIASDSDDFAEGARSALARAISAEVRARMAAQRITGRDLAAAVRMSHTYLAKRLRDELPFTVDDLDRLLRHWSEDATSFVQTAYANHFERIMSDSQAARDARAQETALLEEDRDRLEREASDQERSSERDDYDLAAHDEEHTIEDEQGHDEFP